MLKKVHGGYCSSRSREEQFNLSPSCYLFPSTRWRRRWFVLQQGKLPRQYMLNYYADETKRRLKGTISLDECEQVDIGLTAENGRQRYEFMFDIKTPKRIYFLAVDTHEDMTTWVQMVCSACGLTSTKDDESVVYSAPQQDNVRGDTTAHEVLQTTRNLHEDATPQLSCASEASNDVSSNSRITGKSSAHPSISSPYIHLSTCYAGKVPSDSHVGTEQSVAKPLSSPTVKLSNMLPRGSTSIFHGKVIDSLISSSSKGLGTRTRTKSSHSEAELIESTTITKSFSSKASHGFSNSLKKIRRHSSTGGGLKCSTPKTSSDVSKSSDRAGSMPESSSMDVDSMTECGPEGACGESLSDEKTPLSGNDEVTISDLRTHLQSGLVVLPPERPPKPAHLVSGSTESSTIKPGHTDNVPTYLHSAENYANASDMQELYLKEQNNNVNGELQNQPGSQHIQYSANHVHQFHKHNHTHHHIAPSTAFKTISKPNIPTDPHQAPMISRELKPNRRNITSRNRSQTIGGSMMASTYGMSSAMAELTDDALPREGYSSNLASNVTSNNFATLGPPVVRALKPKHSDTIGSRSRFNSLCSDLAMIGSIGRSEAESNSRRNSVEDEQIYYYMPPVNTTSGLGGLSSTLHPPLMIPAESFDNPSISYIDLDLPKTSSTNKVNSSASSEETLNDIKTLTNIEKSHVRAQRSLSAKDGMGACSNNSSENKTIYKTVDFIKTNALNRIKRDIESERGHSISDNQQFQSNMPTTLTGGGSNCGIIGAAGGNLFNREF